MAKEIERKFLVVNNLYETMAESCHHIVQGYVSLRPEGTVRVRIRDNQAFITIKGLTRGAERDEWEYPVPLADALQMLERVTEGAVIDKERFMVPYGGHLWEVDRFSGVYAGMVVAEIELDSADTEFPLPPFIGAEVTGDPSYYNSSLAAGRSSGDISSN
ncbi:MAG: CYTH domain-containing protein [Muribaculaceae bacterium]|nr:CYTH domain-containing protein [Muribaculaceae bacterium]